MQEPWSKKLTSRKFILSILAALLPIFNDAFGWGLDTEAVYTTIAAVIGFVFSETALDRQRINTEQVIGYNNLKFDALNEIGKLQAQLQGYQSGKVVAFPSDDPSASGPA